MHACIATLGLAANHYPANGLDHLRIMERPDAYIIFPSSCPSEYSLRRVTRYMNHTQVRYTAELRQVASVVVLWPISNF